MKKILAIGICMFALIASAQTQSGIGLKGGANYGSTGELKEDGRSILENPDDKLGFHIGGFVKADFGRFYVKPELVFTKLNSEYDGQGFEIQKLDAPLLVGVNLFGPMHIFAGPSLQYILDTELENVDLGEVQEEFTVGGQIGIGVNIGNLGIDVRYERGFQENEVEFINDNIVSSSRFSIDTRPEQIILGISLRL